MSNYNDLRPWARWLIERNMKWALIGALYVLSPFAVLIVAFAGVLDGAREGVFSMREAFRFARNIEVPK